MADTVAYLRLSPGATPPASAGLSPFRAVVVVEESVSEDWQALVSDWLVRSGCLFMAAWGMGCSSWDDSVDIANIEAFNGEEIPEDAFVMTTWHENEPLEEAFWFAKFAANHSTIELTHTLLVHISSMDGEMRLLRAYESASAANDVA